MAPVEDVRAVESWFVANGLPYFVDEIREDVTKRLRPARLVSVLLVGLVLAAPIGLGVGLWADRWSYGVSSALTTVAVIFALYALLTLKAWLWIRWAAGQTLGSLSLMVPLVTRLCRCSCCSSRSCSSTPRCGRSVRPSTAASCGPR